MLLRPAVPCCLIHTGVCEPLTQRSRIETSSGPDIPGRLHRHHLPWTPLLPQIFDQRGDGENDEGKDQHSPDPHSEEHASDPFDAFCPCSRGCVPSPSQSRITPEAIIASATNEQAASATSVNLTVIPNPRVAMA